MTPVLISIKQVAELLSLSTRTVRRAWYSGELPPPIRIGRSVRWRLLDIENYQGNYDGERLQTNRT
ncbi:helix-turn-helix domain-containing protein [Lacipirellula parvula]|uniref:helix-turn-helix transcriptional regulator n=1 Tax=Lacipirellula parvula TaxID=2650471 RepID=UPI00126095BC